MKRKFLLLLVICCVLFCGCGNSVKAGFETEKSQETQESLGYACATDIDMFTQFLCWADVKGEIVDILIKGQDSSNLEYEVRYTYNDSISSDKLSRYDVRIFDSLLEYQETAGFEEKIIVNETIIPSGECIIILKEEFPVARGELQNYIFTTDDIREYLYFLQFVTNELGYEFIDIKIENDTYSIIYKESNKFIPKSENEQYTYMVYTYPMIESKYWKNQWMEQELVEIIDETTDVDNKMYYLTMRLHSK